MENEIKVGDWIRTKAGHIGKVLDITNVTGQKRIKYLIKWNISEAYYITSLNIVKHSLNLIDIIQKDDFVNGDRVVAVDYTEDENGNYIDVLGIMEIDDDYAYPIELRVINIREVVTKEQFESISYKVERKDKSNE